MKLTLIISLVFIIGFSSCKKAPEEKWFLIEVKASANVDCGIPEIVFIDRKEEAYQIIGDNRGIYVASGLPKVLYAAGTRMYVTIQKPDAGQAVICTTMGPSWNQVQINSVK
jgi:hypothetical protein